MKLFNLFTRRTPKTTTKNNRTVLSLNSLEARDVPAALDLSGVGSSGKINGAIFSQSAANGAITPFLRIDDGGKEQGYNTNARPLQFDESRSATKALKVSDIPSVIQGGVEYKELVLDVNEPRWSPKISLDEMRIYVSDNPNLKNYKTGKDTLGGLKPVWDMDANKDWFVRVDASNNGSVGTGDMTVLIPANLLTGGTYLSLFSRFGERNAAGGTYEQWGTRPVVEQPPQNQTVTLTGFLLADSGDGNPANGFTPWYDVTVVVFKNGVQFATQNVTGGGNGSFSISFEKDTTSTYTIQAFSNEDSSVYSAELNVTDFVPGQDVFLVINE